MTKHLRFLFVMLLAMIWSAGWAAVGDNFKLVTDAKDLKAGDKIIIGSKASGKVLGADNGKNKRMAVSATFSNDGVVAWQDGFEVITLEGSASAWYLHLEDGYLYSDLDKKGKSNTNLKASPTKSDNNIASITVATNGTSTISFIKVDAGRAIFCNTSVTPNIFGYYQSSFDKKTLSQIYKLVNSGDKDKTSTTLSLGDYANKTFSFTNGKSDDTFNTPTATVTPAAATGAVQYTSSDKDIVTVATNGDLTFTNTKFGSATISAQFIATGDYANSNTVTYTVVNKEPQKTATEVTFGDKSQQTITLTEGDVTGVVFPKASEKNNIAGTVSYESSNTDVAVVDADGNVTIKGAYGESTITATFTPSGETYAVSTDWYKVKNKRSVVEGTITFDNNNGAFASLGSYNANSRSLNFISDSKESFAFECTNVRTGDTYKCLQMKRKEGKIVSPTFSKFTNGYKVYITYSSSKALTLSVGDTNEVGTTTSTNNTNGLGADVSISVPVNGQFIVTAGDAVTYISKIEIIPNKVDETTAITLDEKSESNTIEAKNGVNVTLKRTMVANEWNTICLPFEVSEKQAKDAFGEGVKIAELNANSTGNTLSFKSVEVISATKPYLIKPSKENTSNEYVFENVNVVKNDADAVITTDDLAFVGIYNMVDITKNVTEVLYDTYYAAFLGAGNKIYKTDGSGNKTKGFRAYFAIPNGAAASALRVVIDGTATSIKNIDSEVVESNAPVYNLQGQRVNGNNLTPGIYVKAGKKFVVK